jgi:hypothetical protein
MKSAIIIAIIMTSLAQQKCEKHIITDIPSCIQARIDEIKKQPRWNPPAQVEEYRYDGRRVFLFSANCCDQFTQVVDEACNYICAPSGGITGKGDRKCADFNEKAQLIKVVWKDERK